MEFEARNGLSTSFKNITLTKNVIHFEVIRSLYTFILNIFFKKESLYVFVVTLSFKTHTQFS